MKVIKKFLIAGVMSALCILPVAAAPAPLSSYVIDGADRLPLPQTYEYERSINAIYQDDTWSWLNQPSDLYMDDNGFLYVADTGNNRVVKLKKTGEFMQEYRMAGDLPFVQPNGICVDKNGDIYIADTGNSRVVHLSSDGTLLREFGKPDSPYLADVSMYSPTKLGIAPNGGLYILMGENIMSVNAENQFQNFIGQPKVGYNFVDWLLRLVASDTQKNRIEKRTTASFENLTVENGLIYAVSGDKGEGQVKVLNSVGTNIYRKLSVADSPSIGAAVGRFLSGNILYKGFAYGETTEDGKPPLFSDICVNADGILSVLEKQMGKIYQYDQNGNLLAVFGGLGDAQGEFAIPVSIVTDGEKLYVLDNSLGNIQIFKPTHFITTIQQATTAYYNGEYEKAAWLWEEVSLAAGTYPLAHYGIAQTQFKAENWEAAMEGFRNANDRTAYSRAFVEQRYVFTKEHFPLVLMGTLVAVVAAGILIVIGSKSSRRSLYALEYGQSALGLKDSLLLGVGMLYRPGRTLDAIKNARGRLKSYGAWFFLLLVFLVRLVFIFTVHYPLQDIEMGNVNLVLEFIKLMAFPLTWIVAVYLLSAQFEGESTFSECVITTAYSMVPYIVLNLLAAGLSHILCMQEKGLFALLVNGVWFWIAWLMIRSVRRMNDYSIGKMLFICLITLVAVILIWFICLFSYSLVARLIKFVQELLQEVSLILS